MLHSRWRLLPRVPAEFAAEMPSLSPLVVQLLYNRGIRNFAEADLFLNPDKRLCGDPFLLIDMDRAVARIREALLHEEKMAIYGDFDADGICGTALLVQGISALGGDAIPYIPHRLEEDRGLSEAGLDKLRWRGVTLVITVDCGTDSVDEVEYARAMAMDVIITDHHMPMSGFPTAMAIVNPRRGDSAHPQLAGVGVAFKLLQALCQTLGKEEQGLESFLDLVALGTIADMVPLVDENRYLVKQGLGVLNSTGRVGLNELMEITGLCPGAVDAESISMVLAPCLNASGRIAHAFTSYKLLVTDSREEAYQLAIDMKQENAERRRLTGEIVSTAREQVLDTGIDVPLLMVGGENYHPGVIGLVASRLVDEFHRPAIALNIGAEMSQGSSRSIPEFDIISALGECRDILSRFGGHPMAAGFTIATADVERLRRCLLEKASRQLAGFDFSSCLPIDAEVQLSSLGGETFSTIQRFAPFGVGNQIPALLSRGVRVTDCRSAGNGGRHLRLKLRDDDITWDGIGFGLGEYIEQVTPNIDIVYRLGVDDWGGKRLLQLDILDFAPSE